jgi:hypothetical protein
MVITMIVSHEGHCSRAVEIHGCIVVLADVCALCDILFREDAADLITLIDQMCKVPSTKEVGKLLRSRLGVPFSADSRWPDLSLRPMG